MNELINLQGTIFLLIAVGFMLKRCKLINNEGQKTITDLVINVILPCNIIKAFCIDLKSNMGKEMVYVFFISLLIQIFSVFYGKFIFRSESENRNKCLRYGTICSNAGFLGNPIAEGIYGSYGLMLASVFLIPARISMWSAGISIFSGSSDIKGSIQKTLRHPCILACILGTILLLTGYRFPKIISSSIGYLGSCNTAMSMLIIGLILGDLNLKTLFDKTVVLYSFHRLILIPLIVFGITWLLPVSSIVRGLSVMLTAMPAGATTSILSAKYDTDPTFGSKLVIFSTLFSLPTLIIWNMFLI